MTRNLPVVNVVLAAFLLFMLVFVGACPDVGRAPQLPQTGIGYRVSVEDALDGRTGWTPAQRAVITGRVLDVLSTTGDRWVRSETGDADLVVYAYVADDGCAVEGSGRYVPGARFVEIDPACTPSEDVLAWVAVHEALHWLTWQRARWVGHVCLYRDEAADCHDEIFGTAALNPRVPALGDGLSLGVYLHPADARLLSVLPSAHGR